MVLSEAGSAVQGLLADGADPGADALTRIARDVFDAVERRDWQWLAGFALVALVFFARKYAKRLPGKAGEFFGTQNGGTVLVMLTACLGGLGTALLGHVKITPQLAMGCFNMGLVAAGGWHAVVRPILEALRRPKPLSLVPPAPPPPNAGFARPGAILALCVASFAVSLLVAHRSARADVDKANPAASYGALTLAAATATRIPPTGLQARGSVNVKNLDAARIWCGWNSAVTDSSGWPVEPLGGAESFPASFNSAGTAALLFCYSAAGTAANGLRWMEIR